MKKLLVILLCFNFITMPAFCLVEDELVEKSLDKNLKIKSHDKEIIVDDFAQNNLKKSRVYKKTINLDEKIPEASNQKAFKKVVVLDENNFIPVKVKIKSPFSTEQNYDEGDYIDFVNVTDINIKDTVYPKGSIIKARIETLSKNKMQGVPADLTVGNFSIDNNPLQGEINKTGANRSLWVYPAMCGGSIFFGAGLLLGFIKGGHAKIRPKETFVLYLEK